MQKSLNTSNSKLKSIKTKSTTVTTSNGNTGYLLKLIQKKFYNLFLKNNNFYYLYVFLFLAILLLTLFVIIPRQKLLVLVDASVNYKTSASQLSIYRSGENDAVDAVYTWVNGSDLEHIKELNKLKENYKNISSTLSNSTDHLTQIPYQKIDYNLFINIIKNYNESDLKSVLNKWKTDYNCYYRLCIKTPLLIPVEVIEDQTYLLHMMFIVRPGLSLSMKYDLENSLRKYLTKNLAYFNLNSNSNSSVMILNIKLNSSSINNNMTIFFKLQKIFNKVVVNKSNFKLYLAYYAIDNCELETSNCVSNGPLAQIFAFKAVDRSKKSNESNLNNDSVMKYVVGNNLLKNLIQKSSTISINSSLTVSTESSSSIVDIYLPGYLSDNLEYKLVHEYQVHSDHAKNDLFHQQVTTSTKSSNEKSRSKLSFIDEIISEKLFILKLNSIGNVNLTGLFDSVNSSDGSNNQFIANFSVFDELNNKTHIYDIYKMSIVYDLGDPLGDDLAQNRFFDNNELKYSLRSIEKYAPWLRTIYLVTNGQVPNWLNRSHPKIKLIQHKDIFLNKTHHLPTFSSAAIECHLHRIPGLSKHFLYFNDDILLGKPIYRDDFYTKTNGYKIYLAWALPGCNERCPNNWIHDGYCDKVCNTTECEFDGGDCLKNNATLALGRGALGASGGASSALNNLFCSNGCATSWLADRYCDSLCNNIKCAYDMGDCGIESFVNLHEINLLSRLNQDVNNETENNFELDVKLPKNIDAFYVNYTINATESHKISNATYIKKDFIRTIAIMNKYRIMTVLLLPNDDANANMSAINNKFKIYLKFDVSNTSLSFLLNIELNALDADSVTTTTTTVKSTTVSDSQITDLLTAKIPIITTKSIIEYKKLMPKLLDRVNSTQNEIFYDDAYIFKNKLLNKIFQNYKSYLNWSLNMNYLSLNGYKYKINNFIKKFQNDKLLNRNATDDDDNKIDYNLIENMLFLNDTISKYDLDLYLNHYYATNTSDNNNNLTDSEDIFKKRKLLDTFADSLLYVNRIYNRVYGYLARKVPAHMPHYIDRDIIESLQRKFPNEFEKTSSNRIRSKQDMQFAFSYYYYLFSELSDTLNINVTELDDTNVTDIYDRVEVKNFTINLFNEFDLNLNEKLDKLELDLLKLRYEIGYAVFTSINIVLNNNETSHFNSLIFNCNSNNNSQSNINESLTIDKHIFLNCNNLTKFLIKKYYQTNKNTAKKYKYELLDDINVYFQMISAQNNAELEKIDAKLKYILKEPRKFICLNDNINYKVKSFANKLKNLLENFYLTLFPLKSKFEIDDGLKKGREKEVNIDDMFKVYDNYFESSVEKEIISTLFIPIVVLIVLMIFFYLFYRYNFKFFKGLKSKLSARLGGMRRKTRRMLYKRRRSEKLKHIGSTSSSSSHNSDNEDNANDGGESSVSRYNRYSNRASLVGRSTSSSSKTTNKSTFIL